MLVGKSEAKEQLVQELCSKTEYDFCQEVGLIASNEAEAKKIAEEIVNALDKPQQV